ncbi:MAG: hypothetical protein LBG15_03815 [Dysgonamonadaceae bacterium]|nr:hypothetical protein [Dysgonamonadaceae bacterium]
MNRMNLVKIVFYVLIWCIFLMVATYPSVILNWDFSFLSENSLQGIFKNYIFSMVMVFVLFLSDIAYPILSSKIDMDNMKLGWVSNIITTIIIALCLIFLCIIDNFGGKIFCFILFWVTLLVYKIISIYISSDSVKKQRALNVWRD